MAPPPAPTSGPRSAWVSSRALVISSAISVASGARPAATSPWTCGSAAIAWNISRSAWSGSSRRGPPREPVAEAGGHRDRRGKPRHAQTMEAHTGDEQPCSRRCSASCFPKDRSPWSAATAPHSPPCRSITSSSQIGQKIRLWPVLAQSSFWIVVCANSASSARSPAHIHR
jgi:hypothetical protein